MEAWILFTIAAAFLQNIRNTLQKSLNSVLSTGGAAYTRFAFGLPLAVIYWLILFNVIHQDLNWGVKFWTFVVIGGTAQVLAMVTLLRAFSLRGFAVGTAFAKTETIQTAIFSILILSESVSQAAFIAIALSFVGVCFLSLSKAAKLSEFLYFWRDKAAMFGLASAALLALSGVSYRGAALSMGGEGALLQASSVLVIALILQTFQMTVYLAHFEKGQLTEVWRHRFKSSLVGIASMMGSVGWFTAMTLQNAAYVRALGQVELVFTLLTSIFIFRERISPPEGFGMALVVSGIFVLLFG